MFSRIQTRNFRSLRGIDQGLQPFQALVGPNASGKTTFLDVFGLLSDLARSRGDVSDIIAQRSANFADLLWMREGDSFQLAVEARIPDDIRAQMAEEMTQFDSLRYEVEIGLDAAVNEIGLNWETLWYHSRAISDDIGPDVFPGFQCEKSSILTTSQRRFKKGFGKKPGGNDNFYPEGKAQKYNPAFPLGRTKAGIANLPGGSDIFPVADWLRNLLQRGVQNIVLNSRTIREPSPPGLGLGFRTDGSNLPWVIEELRKQPVAFRGWLDHVRTALEDIDDISTIERPEDRHKYLVVRYRNGAVVPSWLVSDGTLRLLALTIPAYLPTMTGVFLVEEPENGIHPRAIETVLQSLRSIYSGQVLIATHSPVALNMLEASDVLCFAKDSAGATDIVSGDKHPALRDWKSGSPDLGLLFASGILS